MWRVKEEQDKPPDDITLWRFLLKLLFHCSKWHHMSRNWRHPIVVNPKMGGLSEPSYCRLAILAELMLSYGTIQCYCTFILMWAVCSSLFQMWRLKRHLKWVPLKLKWSNPEQLGDQATADLVNAHSPALAHNGWGTISYELASGPVDQVLSFPS